MKKKENSDLLSSVPKHSYVILAAGGLSQRMGGINKLMAKVGNRTVLWRSTQIFWQHPGIAGLVVVGHEEYLPEYQAELDSFTSVSGEKFLHFCPGGATRAQSVQKGLLFLQQILQGAPANVLVHDAARCLLRPQRIDQILDLLSPHRLVAVAPARLASDTVAVVGENPRRIDSIPDRSRTWLVQTPQAADLEVLLEAHAQAERMKRVYTDDLTMLSQIGLPIRLIPGDADNIKVTSQEDLPLAEYLFQHQLDLGIACP